MSEQACPDRNLETKIDISPSPFAIPATAWRRDPILGFIIALGFLDSIAMHFVPIPKLIHQTFSSMDRLPATLRDNCEMIRSRNPEFEYHFYSDDEMLSFVRSSYGGDIARIYARIDPAFGAARADLFRYLCLYWYGGVYLDVKADVRKPLASVIRETDSFILSRWDHSSDSPHAGWGSHHALHGTGSHAFQQWFIIASPRHPFLKAVIDKVLKNIENYDPFKHFRNSWNAVIETTGEVPYTLAILPMLDSYPHRLVVAERDLDLHYSIFLASGGVYAHQKLHGHYSALDRPLIRQPWPLNWMFGALARVRAFARWLKRQRCMLR